MAAGSEPEEKFDIVVAGGSYAGLAFVRGLVQALGSDLRIAIVDRVRGPAAAPTDGRAFAIWAGAKAVLEGLGVWQAIAGEAEAMTSIEISDSALQDGMRPTRLTMTRTHRMVSRQPTWCPPQR